MFFIGFSDTRFIWLLVWRQLGSNYSRLRNYNTDSFNSLSYPIYPLFMLIENRACLHDLKQQRENYLWSLVIFGPLLWLIRGAFYFNPFACACPAKTKSVVATPALCCFSLSVHTTYFCVLVGPFAEEEANPSPIVVVFITLVCINACVFFYFCLIYLSLHVSPTFFNFFYDFCLIISFFVRFSAFSIDSLRLNIL